MNLTTLLLHRIADPTLTLNDRARLRCQLAKEYEEAGNYDAAREAMGELWRGVGHDPVLEGLDQTTSAEVLLRAGVLTGWIGSCKQIKGAQETAKNLISQSVTIFEGLQDAAKVAEAQMELGPCYWREGALNEARDVLKEALTRIPDEARDLKAITTSRLATVEKITNRLSDALRLLTEAAPLFKESSNDSIKGRFHNEYGTVLKNLGRIERRSDYIDRALIEYAAASFHFEQAGHRRYQAYVENNLGMLFCTAGRFPEAHEHLDRAQALFTSLKDKAHIAQVDETRARVLLAEGRISKAEKIAKSAVHSLEASDDLQLFAEALTTHGITLARLGRHQQAHLTLQAAVEVAANAGDPEGAGQAALIIIEDLGNYLNTDDLICTYTRAVDLLASSQNLSTLVRLSVCAQRVLFLVGLLPSPPDWKGFFLKEAVRIYEGRIIARALKDAGSIVTRAARLLGYKNHNSLIDKIKNRHPELLSTRSPVEPRKQSLIFIDEEIKKTQPVTVMHVEDRHDVANAVKETLEGEGWKVETCTEGSAALRLLESDAHFDVLIFDNKLPDTTGVELIRQTRLIPHRQQTPIIMLSACEVEAEARRAGANVFLKKPNDMMKVSETIARLLAARKPKHSKGK